MPAAAKRTDSLERGFVPEVVRLWSDANQLTAPLAQLFFDVSRRPVPPDLEAAGFPLETA